MTINSFSIYQVNWADSYARLAYIRRTVFIEEQKVPEDLEWDGKDEQAIHLLAVDTHNQAIGCVRMLQGGHIGRMAVLNTWRNKGVGSRLLNQVIMLAKQMQLSELTLSAQSHAIQFYEHAGFKTYGEEYFDAAILHQEMKLSISLPCHNLTD